MTSKETELITHSEYANGPRLIHRIRREGDMERFKRLKAVHQICTIIQFDWNVVV